MKNNKRPAKSLVIAAFAAIYIIWGSTYLGIKLAIETIPPLIMGGTRFLLAGIILLGWSFSKGEKLPSPSSLLPIALSGVLMLFLGNGAVAWVERFIPSGLAAIIVATVPLWLVLLDKRQWKFYFTNRQIIIGLLVGFAGVILLFSGKTAGDLFTDRMKFISLLVLGGGTIAWTIGTLYSKYRKMEGSTTMKVGIQMIAASLLFYPLALATGEHHGFEVSNITTQSILALLYLVLVGSVVAYLAYMWLLSVKPASLVGTYAYVNPVVAVFLGWLVAGEQVSGMQAIGLGIIIAGLVIVNISKEKKSETIEKAERKAA